MSDQDTIRAIAMASAERLAPEIDPKLPGFTAAALDEPHTGRGPERFLDPSLLVSIAALLVSAAGLAWQIYHDIKSDSPKQPVSPEVLARKVQINLEVNLPLEPGQQKSLVRTVVAETLENVQEHTESDEE